MVRPGEPPRSLCRAADGRLVAGVCAGLADYFDVDVVLVRVVAVALALVAGVAVPLYLAAWLLLPEEDTGESIAERILCGAHRWVPTHAGAEGDEGGGRGGGAG